MELLEVYVQGVSRFLTPFKFNLSKGYNVVYGGNESGKTVLAKALVATFDGPYAAAAAERLQPVSPQEGALRYGALFEHNGDRYRLLRDLAGGINLAKMNSATQKFEPLAKDEQGVTDFLQDFIDFPLDGLFPTFGLVDRNLAPAASASAPASSGFASSSSSYDDEMAYGGEQAGASSESIEKELKQLRRELGVLGSIDQIEFRLEGMQRKRYENEAVITKFKDIESKIADIEKRQQVLAPIEALTPDFESRVKNLDKQEEYQRQRLQALDTDIRQLERALDVLDVKRKRKFQKDPFFIGGAVAAVVGFVLPFITKEFLVLIGFAGAGWLAYLFFFIYAKIEADFLETEKKHRTKCNEEEKLKKEFETATSVIRELVKTLKVLDAKDLLELAAEWKQSKETLAGLRQAREELSKAGGNEAKVRQELERQDAEIALFEEELRSAGAITRDTNQIQAEIQRLELQRDRGTNAPSPVAAAVIPVQTGSIAGTGANLGQFIEGVARLSRRGIDEVVPLLTEKMNTYVRALAGGKLGPVQLSADGELSLTRAEFGNRKVSLAELSEGTRDSVLLALRFGALELIQPSRQFPVIFDDPFSLLDDQRQAVAAKALKRLAGFTQVIHFTSQKSFLALADTKIELK